MPLKKLNTQQENTNDGIVLINTDEATIVKASAIYKSMLNELVENYISENEDVYNNTMFYGGVPIDLEAESLLHIVQYNITEDKKRRQYLYNITSKLDGLRLLMFIHPLMESVMFIDRKPNFYEASLNENTREKYNIMQNFTSVTGLNKNKEGVSKHMYVSFFNTFKRTGEFFQRQKSKTIVERYLSANGYTYHSKTIHRVLNSNPTFGKRYSSLYSKRIRQICIGHVY